MLPPLLSSSNLLSSSGVEFPAFFTLYCFLFALAVLYYLLLSPHVRGAVISAAARWIIGREHYIKISGLGFALLSGKIYLSHIEYRSKNICVRVLQSTIRFNWWFTEVRQAESRHDDLLPCRLSIELVGMEYMIYNNSSAYDYIDQLILQAGGADVESGRRKENEGGKQQRQRMEEEKEHKREKEQEKEHERLVDKEENSSDVNENGRYRSDADSPHPPSASTRCCSLLPSFYRFFPVTKVTIKSLHVMIGNVALPQVLVFSSSSLQVLHVASIDDARAAVSPYAISTEVRHIKDACLYLRSNYQEYMTPSELHGVKRALEREDYFERALVTMGRILQERNPHPPQWSEKRRKGERPWPHRDKSMNDNTAHSARQKRGGNPTQSNMSDDFGPSSSFDVSGGDIEMAQLGPNTDAGYGLGFETEHLYLHDVESNNNEEDEMHSVRIDEIHSPHHQYTNSNDGARRRGKHHRRASLRDIVSSSSTSSRSSSSPSSSTTHGYYADWVHSSSGCDAEHELILACADAHLDYCYDVSPTQSAADASWMQTHHSTLLSHAPRQRLEIHFLRHARVRYGPWMDFHRSKLMDWFKPYAYQNQEIVTPMEGKEWPYANFDIHIKVGSESCVQMPYAQAEVITKHLAQTNAELRGLHRAFSAPSHARSPDPSSSPVANASSTSVLLSNPAYASGLDSTDSMIQLCFNADSWMTYDMGWSVVDANKGNDTTLKAHLIHAALWSPVPSSSSLPASSATTQPVFQSLVECDLLEIDGVLNYPTQWNAWHHWVYSFHLHHASLFYLSAHLDVFRAISRDWSRWKERSKVERKVGSGERLKYFVPSTMEYKVVFVGEYQAFWNVNENNVSDVYAYPEMMMADGEDDETDDAETDSKHGAASTSSPMHPFTSQHQAFTPAVDLAPASSSSSSSSSPSSSLHSFALRYAPAGSGSLTHLGLNTYIILRGPDLSARIIMPYKDFLATKSKMEYEVSMRNVRAHLSLPQAHPLRELMADANPNMHAFNGAIGPGTSAAAAVIASAGAQMVYANHLRVCGDMDSHYSFHPSYHDTHALRMACEGLDIDLHGHNVRALRNLQSNYFGAFADSITGREYEMYGYRNIYTWRRTVKENETAAAAAANATTSTSAVGAGTGAVSGGAGGSGMGSHDLHRSRSLHTTPTDPSASSTSTTVSRNLSEFHLSVHLENLSGNLPLHLFSQPSASTQPKVRLYTASMEMRSLAQYFEMELQLAPITITLPIQQNSTLMQIIRTCERRDGGWMGKDDTARHTNANGVNQRSERDQDSRGNINGNAASHGMSAMGGRSWNEKESYVHLKDLSFSWHEFKGDPPRMVVYRSLKKVRLAQLLIQLFPQQCMTLVHCIQNFQQQWQDATDHRIPPSPLDDANNLYAVQRGITRRPGVRETGEEAQIRMELIAYLQELQLTERMADTGLEVSVGCVQINMLHPPLPTTSLTATRAQQALQQAKVAQQRQQQDAAATFTGVHSTFLPSSISTSHLSLTRILLQSGIHLSSTSLISPQSYWKMLADIPALDFDFLICTDGSITNKRGTRLGSTHTAPPSISSPTQRRPMSESHWVSLFHFSLGLRSTRAFQRNDWLSAFRKQQDFIYSQMHQESYSYAYSTWAPANSGGGEDREASAWQERNANKVHQATVDETTITQPNNESAHHQQHSESYHSSSREGHRSRPISRSAVRRGRPHLHQRHQHSARSQRQRAQGSGHARASTIGGNMMAVTRAPSTVDMAGPVLYAAACPSTTVYHDRNGVTVVDDDLLEHERKEAGFRTHQHQHQHQHQPAASNHPDALNSVAEGDESSNRSPLTQLKRTNMSGAHRSHVSASRESGSPTRRSSEQIERRRSGVVEPMVNGSTHPLDSASTDMPRHIRVSSLSQSQSQTSEGDEFHSCIRLESPTGSDTDEDDEEEEDGNSSEHAALNDDADRTIQSLQIEGQPHPSINAYPSTSINTEASSALNSPLPHAPDSPSDPIPHDDFFSPRSPTGPTGDVIPSSDAQPLASAQVSDSSMPPSSPSEPAPYAPAPSSSDVAECECEFEYDCECEYEYEAVCEYDIGRLPDFVSPLPPADLDGLLLHYVLDSASHAFIMNGSSGTGAAGLNGSNTREQQLRAWHRRQMEIQSGFGNDPLYDRAPSATQHAVVDRATVVDASLGGTSTGAFLSTPIVRFHATDFDDESEGYEERATRQPSHPPPATQQPSLSLVHSNSASSSDSLDGRQVNASSAKQPAAAYGSLHSSRRASLESSDAILSMQPIAVMGSGSGSGRAGSLAKGRSTVTDLSSSSPLPASRSFSNQFDLASSSISSLPSSTTFMGPAGLASQPHSHSRAHAHTHAHAQPPSGSASTSASALAPVVVEPVVSKHPVYVTEKIVFEVTSTVRLRMCPHFIANLDHYLPLLLPSQSLGVGGVGGGGSVEDALDELHRQFSAAFHTQPTPIEVRHGTATQADKAREMHAERDRWHISSVQYSFIIPNIVVELMQLSAAALDEQTAAAIDSNGNTSNIPTAGPSTKHILYTTTLDIDGLTGNVALSYPLPQLHTNTSTGMTTLDPHPKPALQAQVSMNQLHAYACIVDSASLSPSSSSSSSLFSSLTSGANSIVIPSSQLESILPECVTSTSSAVFFSASFQQSVLSCQHNTYTELNHAYQRPRVIHTPGLQSNTSATMQNDDVNAAVNATATPITPTGQASQQARRESLKPQHQRAPSSSLNSVMSSPGGARHTRGRLETSTVDEDRTVTAPPTVIHHHDATATTPFSFSADDVAAHQDDDNPANLTFDAEEHIEPVFGRSYYLNPSLASPIPIPSPSTSNAFHHSHSTSLRFHTSNAVILSGWDAPSRAVIVSRDWMTALTQLELLTIAKEWMGEPAVKAAREHQENEEDARNSTRRQNGNRTNSSLGSSHESVMFELGAEKRGKLSDPAYSLFSMLPAGPGTRLRRARWQALLSFALQHVLHSRALDASRGGSKAFTEADQLRLIQWCYYRCKQNRGWTKPGASDPSSASPTKHDAFIEDELGQILSAYRVATNGVFHAHHHLYQYQHEHQHHASQTADRVRQTDVGAGLGYMMDESRGVGEVAAEDVNFIQSAAAPLSITLRKLLKLPPSLMRRLNFKLQRAEEAAWSQSLRADADAMPQTATGLTDSDVIDYVKLLESEKLKATDLARFSLHLFALLAPQACKVKSITHPAQLFPALWPSVHCASFHRSDTDNHEMSMEWEVKRVRLRVIQPESRNSNESTSTTPSITRDHAISMNGWSGMAMYERRNQFTRIIIRRPDPPQTVPYSTSNLSARPTTLSPSSIRRLPPLSRMAASRFLTRDSSQPLPLPIPVPMPSPTSDSLPNVSPMLTTAQRTRSEKIPSSHAPWNHGGGSNGDGNGSRMGMSQDRGMGGTIFEGHEDSHSLTPQPQIDSPLRNPFRRLEVATPTTPARNAPASHLSFPAVVATATAAADRSHGSFPILPRSSSPPVSLPSLSHPYWHQCVDVFLYSHLSDMLVDVGPEIHRFLASMVSATFVFAEMHRRTTMWIRESEGERTNANRRRKRSQRDGEEEGGDEEDEGELHQGAASIASHAAQPTPAAIHRHSLQPSSLIGGVLLSYYVHHPLVQSSIFVQCHVSTIGIRARVPGTASLHIVCRDSSICLNRFRTLDQATLDARHRKARRVGKGKERRAVRAGGGAAAASASARNNGMGRTYTVGESPQPILHHRPTWRSALDDDEDAHDAANMNPLDGMQHDHHMIAASYKMSEFDIRLLDQDGDEETLDEMTDSTAAAIAHTSSPPSNTIHTNNTAAASAHTNPSPSAMRSTNPGKRRATVLFSLTQRMSTLNVNQTSMSHALSMNQDYLSSVAFAAAVAAPPTERPRGGHFATVANQSEAGLTPNTYTIPGHNRFHSHQGLQSSTSWSGKLAGAGMQHLAPPNMNHDPMHASSSSSSIPSNPSHNQIVSTGTSVTSTGVDRVMFVMSSSESVLTLPFHELDRVHLRTYLDPWTPLVAVFDASSALDRVKAERKAEAIQKQRAVAQTQAEGYTAAAFAWMRGEGRHAAGSNANSRKGGLSHAHGTGRSSSLSMPSYLSPPSPLSSSVSTHWSILVQLSNVHVVMLPLPSVMFIYSLDRLLIHLACPKAQEIQLSISIGRESGKDGEETPATATVGGGRGREGDQATNPSMSSCSTHRISLYSANVRKKKPSSHVDSSSDDHAHSRGSDPAGSRSGTESNRSVARHPLEKPITLPSNAQYNPASRGKIGTMSDRAQSSTTQDPTQRSIHLVGIPGSVAAASSTSTSWSACNPLVESSLSVAVASSCSLASKMQFVLDFHLPTVRASLRIREHDLRNIMESRNVRRSQSHARHGSTQSASMDETFEESTRSMRTSPAYYDDHDDDDEEDDETDDESGSSSSSSTSSSSSGDSSSSMSSDSSDSDSDTDVSDDDVSTVGSPSRSHFRRHNSMRQSGDTHSRRRHRKRHRQRHRHRRRRRVMLVSEIDGTIGVGSMSNHLDENTLSRLLHLQSTLNTELNQLLDKFVQYSKQAGFDDDAIAHSATHSVGESGGVGGVGSVSGLGVTHRGSRGGSISGIRFSQPARGSGVNTPVPADTSSMRPNNGHANIHPNPTPTPIIQSSSPPFVAQKSRGRHVKRLSTLDDLAIFQHALHQHDAAENELTPSLSPMPPPHTNRIGSASKEQTNALSPFAFAQHRSPSYRQNRNYHNPGRSHAHDPNPAYGGAAALAQLEQLKQANTSNMANVRGMRGGRDERERSVWDRYTFNINVVFENIHCTAGLSSKRTSLPSVKPMHASSSLSNPMTQPTPRNPRASNTSGSFAFQSNHSPFSLSSLSDSLSLMASNLSQHDRAAFYHPLLHVSTGSFSLSLRYRARHIIRPMEALAEHERKQREGVMAMSDGDRLDTEVGGIRSTQQSNRSQTRRPNDTLSATAPTFRVEDGSSVIVTVSFHGVGVKLTNLSRLPITTTMQLQQQMQQSLAASAPSSSPAAASSAAASNPRRTLVECRTDLTLRVGIKVNGSYTHADCNLSRSLVKLTAVPLTTASLYVLSTTYMRSYDEFVLERARLVREKEIRDPLIGLRSIKTDRVWSTIQAEFPFHTGNAGTSTTTDGTAPTRVATSQTTLRTKDGGDGLGSAAPVNRRVGSHASVLNVNDGSVESSPSSPTNPLIGTGSMLPPASPAPPTPTGTKYELHCNVESTELVMLFEREQDAVESESQQRAEIEMAMQYQAYGYGSNAWQQTSMTSTEMMVNMPSWLNQKATAHTMYSALVLFMDDLDVHVVYAPPPAMPSRSTALSLYTPLYPSTLPHSYPYPSLQSPPGNSLTAAIELNGLELGCLQDEIRDTNVLTDLADTLRNYRSNPLNAHTHHASDQTQQQQQQRSAPRSSKFGAFGSSGAATLPLPLTPRDASYSAQYPFRSFSMHTSQTEILRTRAHARPHVYNRILCQSTVCQIRGALPANNENNETIGSTNVDNRMSASRQPFHAHSYPSASMTSPLPPSAVSYTRELTLVIDAHSTGAELDIDPSLVNHLTNLTRLVDLLANFTPPDEEKKDQMTLDSTQTTSVPDRSGGMQAKEEQPSNVTAPVHRRPSHPSRSRSASQQFSRAPSQLPHRSPSPSPSSSSSRRPHEHHRHSFSPSSSSSRYVDSRRGRGRTRRRSLSMNDEEDSGGSETEMLRLNDGQMRGDRGEQPSATKATTSPPNMTATASSPSQSVPLKLDVSIEFRLSIGHGRCCLHALPSSAASSPASPSSPPSSTSSSSSSSSSSNVDVDSVYADFVLPSINCTLVTVSQAAEEILLLVDLNLPPITINPSILLFMEEVKHEMEDIHIKQHQPAQPQQRASRSASDDAHPTQASTAPFNTQSSDPSRLIVDTDTAAVAWHGFGASDEGGHRKEDRESSPSDMANASAAASALFPFVNTFAASGRGLTVNVRLKPTYVKLNCIPYDDSVHLQFGSRRSIDLCFTVTALDQAELGLPIVIPYVNCTLNVPAIFLQLARLPHSSSLLSSPRSSLTLGAASSTGAFSASASSSSSSSTSASTFLDVRCRHLKVHWMESYNIRSDGAPIRTMLLSMDSVAPAIITMYAVATALAFCKVWMPNDNETHDNQTETQPTHDHNQQRQASQTSQQLDVSSSMPSSIMHPRAAFYYCLAVDKIEMEVNMMDVKSVNNRSTFSLSGLCGRVLDQGGVFPVGCYPLMATFSTGQLVIAAEPDLDGLDGSFICHRGVELRFCRLPLHTVMADRRNGGADSFDFFSTPMDEESDDLQRTKDPSGYDDGYDSDVGVDSDVASQDGWMDRRASSRYRSRSSSFSSQASSQRHSTSYESDSKSGLMSRQGKRMVNMLSFLLSESSARFHIQRAQGRVDLLQTSAGDMSMVVMDVWNERVDGSGYIKDDGDWSIKLLVDTGERLMVEASSQTFPYLLQLFTTLIEFTQSEFKRVNIQTQHYQQVFEQARRKKKKKKRQLGAHERVDSTPMAASPIKAGRASSDDTKSKGVMSKSSNVRLEPFNAQPSTLGTSSAAAASTPLQSHPSFSTAHSSSPSSSSSPSRSFGGLIRVSGLLIELKLSSPSELGHDSIVVELVDCSVSMQRTLLYSKQQMQQQTMLQQVRMKRQLKIQQMKERQENELRDGDGIMPLFNDALTPTALRTPDVGSMFAGSASVSLSPRSGGSISPTLTSCIRTEEELALALAVLDEETDPLKRLANRQILQSHIGESDALLPFIPLDIHRTLLIDVGHHRRVDRTADATRPAGYTWIPDEDAVDVRQRSFAVGRLGAPGPGIYVSRLTASIAASTSASSTPSSVDMDVDVDHIFRIPGFVLEMESLDEYSSSLLKSRFLTFWDKSITVGIDPRGYKFLQTMMQAYTNKWDLAKQHIQDAARMATQTMRIGVAEEEEQDEEKGEHHAGETTENPSLSAEAVNATIDAADGVETSNGTTPNQLGRSASASASSASASTSSSRPSKGLDPVSYFDLNNPQLHVLDSSSSGISVRKILDVLHVDAAKEEQILPANTHQHITLTLDLIIDACKDITRYIDRTFEG